MFQGGEIYHKVCKDVKRDEELLVWYGEEYQNKFTEQISIQKASSIAILSDSGDTKQRENLQLERKHDCRTVPITLNKLKDVDVAEEIRPVDGDAVITSDLNVSDNDAVGSCDISLADSAAVKTPDTFIDLCRETNGVGLVNDADSAAVKSPDTFIDLCRETNGIGLVNDADSTAVKTPDTFIDLCRETNGVGLVNDADSAAVKSPDTFIDLCKKTNGIGLVNDADSTAVKTPDTFIDLCRETNGVGLVNDADSAAVKSPDTFIDLCRKTNGIGLVNDADSAAVKSPDTFIDLCRKTNGVGLVNDLTDKQQEHEELRDSTNDSNKPLKCKGDQDLHYDNIKCDESVSILVGHPKQQIINQRAAVDVGTLESSGKKIEPIESSRVFRDTENNDLVPVLLKFKQLDEGSLSLSLEIENEQQCANDNIPDVKLGSSECNNNIKRSGDGGEGPGISFDHALEPKEASILKKIYDMKAGIKNIDINEVGEKVPLKPSSQSKTGVLEISCNCPKCADKHLSEHRSKCEECGKTYQCSNVLAKHQRFHDIQEADDIQVCLICSEAFLTSESLKEHQLAEHGYEKVTRNKIKCCVCNKTYNSMYSLIAHKDKKHTSLRPHKCHLCNMKFKVKFLLKQHYRTHTGEKPFSCDVCDKKFRHPASLKSHSKRHHKDKEHVCDVCGQKFKQENSLRSHIITRHDNKEYVCDICGEKLKSAHFLRLHLLKKHKRKMNPCAKRRNK